MAGRNGSKSAEQASLDAATAGIEALSRIDKPTATLTLANGVVVRIKSVPPLLIRTVALQVVDPPIPRTWIPDKDREEENPNDPEYIAALNRTTVQRQNAIADAALMLGTELVSVPDGMARPEDSGWLDDLISLGVQVDPKTDKQRYLLWLRYYAMIANDDITDLIQAALAVTGLTEDEVIDAMSSFRRSAERRTDSAATGPEGGQDGDNVPAVGTGNDTRD